MSFVSPRRHRPSRASHLNLPPNLFARTWNTLRQPRIVLRVAAFALAALVMWLATGAGVPLAAFRSGDVPPRKIIARVDFQLEDVVVGVEWLRTARKPDGAEVSGQHRRRIARLQRAGRKPYPVGLWASVNSYRSGLANASRTFRVILNTHRERESSRPSRYAGHFAGERV